MRGYKCESYPNVRLTPILHHFDNVHQRILILVYFG